jgi:hypothetical protein
MQFIPILLLTCKEGKAELIYDNPQAKYLFISLHGTQDTNCTFILIETGNL